MLEKLNVSPTIYEMNPFSKASFEADFINVKRLDFNGKKVFLITLLEPPFARELFPHFSPGIDIY